MTLNKQQIKFLKKEAHSLKSIYQIGKLGITDNFLEQMNLAIEKNELLKFNILQNSDEEIQEAAQIVADAIEAEVVQTIGHTAVLYRPSSNLKYKNLSSEVNKLNQ